MSNRLLNILITYRADTREFKSALKQADDQTIAAARENLTRRNQDNRKKREIHALDSAAFSLPNNSLSGPATASGGGYAGGVGSAKEG